jgi:hypothetical protein
MCFIDSHSCWQTESSSHCYRLSLRLTQDIPAWYLGLLHRVKLDSMLWHHRFGHIGMDATHTALTKEYVRGIDFEGPFLCDHCISCIVGKSPQWSYSHHGHRATRIGELLHMDICGPYPVQGPRGENYFYNILDNKSNFGFTYGLRHKSDAFFHYLSIESFIERSNGVVILNIRCGGELELTSGGMGKHLVSKGIDSGAENSSLCSSTEW